ncbi:hypothetical protein VE00_07424 [Pseudogymnoascus sp. WSF 3629]|nr:hypothetical protein VE00_07424 [Pseudogymnoascus sp. WSF 3629]
MDPLDGFRLTKRRKVDGSNTEPLNRDLPRSKPLPFLIANTSRLVYRVRRIPQEYTWKQVEELLRLVLELDNAADSVEFRSIASNPDQTKVATVCFNNPPQCLSSNCNEWRFKVPRTDGSVAARIDPVSGKLVQQPTIIIDSNFVGFTILQSVNDSANHEIDCVALSGLGGHAFGSFKSRDGDHMWLCDSLPRDLPGARVMIYGYDSQLQGSNSFQDIESLATSFREMLQSLRTKTVPLILIAHSLGGIIVKEAIIQMNGNKNSHDLIRSIYGAIFFGVPSQGMDIAHLFPLVEGQANTDLLRSLGKESKILRDQCRNFPKAFGKEDSEIFCYYETEKSPTASLDEKGVWKMKGPLNILVDSFSARHGRLVKFSEGDSDYDIVLSKLKSMMSAAVRKIPVAIRRQQRLKESFTKDEKKAIRDSLKFDRMQERFSSVRKASLMTCNWILADPEYQRWLDHSRVSEHYGFLWIKGKPGSGKSTIMKHAVYAAMDTKPPVTVITFFFNARGTLLEKSIIGMYRSLLLQILEAIPTVLDDFQRLFSMKIKHNNVYDWGIGELQEILIAVAKGLQENHVVCFIDALDECKEVLELVKFFEDIGEAAVLSGSYLQICLSTRHYPNIPIRRGIQFTLEKQHGHNQDIITYIENEFIAPHSQHMDYIKAELYRRSSNVFLWVVLVVGLLNDAYLCGNVKPVLLQQLLVSFPEELHNLFAKILEANPNSKCESVLCMQWLVFAREPLTLLELYFAVLSGTEPKALEVWDKKEISYQDACNFILNVSKGLAEVSKSDGTVNLIHESVRDYFLNDGFTKFQPELATNIEGFSEMSLKQCCHQYVLFAIFDAGAGIAEDMDKDEDEGSEEDKGGEEGEESDTSFEYEDEESNTSSEYEDEESGGEDEVIAKLGLQSEDGQLRLDFITRFPFAKYAVRNLFHHAEATQSCGIDQSEFLMEFQCPKKMLLEKWIELYNIVQQTRRNDHSKHESGRYNPDTKLLYIFSDQNLPGLVWILIMKGIDVKAMCKTYHNPLLTASRNGYLPIVQLLITAGAVPNTGESDNLGRNPPELCVAAAEGHLEIAQLLLKSGANINHEGGPIGSPLHAAATYATGSSGQLKIIQLLLDSGADIDCKSGFHGSALQGAASSGNLETVQLLLKSGADVNSKAGNFGSALQAAALVRGKLEIVQLLLESGADVNINGGIHGSALQLAAAAGELEKVQLLLESGAYVNYEGGRYGSALRAAVANRRQNIVILLRQHGAMDSNTHDPSPSI